MSGTYVYVHMYVCAHLCKYVWRPESDIGDGWVGVVSLLISTLEYLEMGSLTEPEVHGWPMSLRDLPV